MSKNTKNSAKSSAETVTIDLLTTRVTVKPDAQVCVVYLGTVGEDVPHNSPSMYVVGELETLTLEAGGTMVDAMLLADHLEHDQSTMLRKDVKTKAFYVYAKPEEAIDLSTRRALDIVKVSRDPACLRAWQEHEQRRPDKRPTILAALKERLRLYGEHSTPRPSLDQLQAATAAARAHTREAPQAEAR